MKKILFLPKFLLPVIVAAVILSVQPVGAQTTWNPTSGDNWSTPGNWSTLAVPGTADDVIFGNAGAGSQNTDDGSFTINSLTYDQDNGSQHTTVINPGQTLTVNSSVAAGTALLSVNSASAATTSSTLVPVAIQGAGGTLTLNGAGDLVVRQGNTANGSHMATLDLSALDTLNATIGRLLVGQANAGASVNRPSGTLILAATNNLTLTGASPQVMVQDSGSNANGSTASVLSFGDVNFLNADTMRFGGQKGNANVNFNNIYSTPPSLVIRNSDGSSPCTEVDFGNDSIVTSGNSTVLTADFSAGTVDLSANTVYIAEGNPGPGSGSCTATLTLGAGTFNVNDLEIGYGIATGANGAATATVNLYNSGISSTGAVITVNTMLRLARSNGGAGAVNGTLNIGSGCSVNANTVVSGGGVSTINLVGGTLVVSNTIGSLAAPIGTVSMSGAALALPALNTGASMVVNNLSGDAVITISKISPIGGYPTTIPIIHYQIESGTSFTLAPLPQGYTGSLVDAGDGSISLNLTAGPVADLTETWTGANGPDWDTSTYNWLYHSIATNYFDGAVVIFNDSTTQTNISLDQALSPNSITVANDALQYTFAGSGNIAATASLTKSGSSSLTLDNQGGDNNISSVVISGGSLQIGAGDTYGGISSVDITNNSALVVDRTDNVTLSSDIAGSGTLTQGGSGTLILSGANTYNGATFVTNGTLEIDQASSGTGPVTTSSGTVLSGIGVVNGPVTVGGVLSPGSSTLLGNFQAGSDLTLSTGSTVNFTLSPTDTSTSDNANDSVVVTGTLTAHNNTINVNFAGVPQASGYTLFTSTSLSGNFNPVVTGTHFPVSLDTTSTPGTVYLDVNGSSGYNLEWNSGSDSTWDNGTTNWLNLANSTPSSFAAGDSVLLGDNSVQTTLTIGAGVTVYPLVITNASDNNNFIISGSGHIGGSASIVKSGASTLNIATVNSFTGTVDIQGGTLQTGNGAALGAATSTTVEDGATLDLDGQNIGGIPITASGSGVNGAGAIINSGPSIVTMAIGVIVMTGDTTFGGTGNWIMNNSGVTASLSTGGNPYNLTKVGANQVTLQNLSILDTALGNIDVQQGTLMFNGITPDMGDPTYTLTVEAGATLAFGADNTPYDKQFVFNGDGTTTTLNNEGGANEVLLGPVTLNGNCVFSIGGTQLIISNNVSGGGGLIKSGTSPLILAGANTYTGDTMVNAGTLLLTNSATLSDSSNITVAAGATLDTGGTGLTLVSGQSLNGSGTVTGTLVAGAGSTVSPGVGGVGTLTVSGAITLSGTNIMELDAANSTNDVLRSSTSSITYGGTLNLVNLGGNPLPGGSSFKLFNASSYIGSFSSIVPATPGPGQTWDTSALGTSGVLKVVGNPGSTQPRIVSIQVQGGSLVISGTNGTASGSYYVLSSTNVALPLADWTPIATNSFSNGSFTFTNSLNPSVPQRFFLLQEAP